METTFGELKLKVIRLLADEPRPIDSGDGIIAGGTYGADLLKDSIHAALDAISARIWKPATFEITTEVDEGDLPADLIAVESVYDNTFGIFIPQISMRVGEVYATSMGNGWVPYPAGKIAFINTIGASGVNIYYAASWAKPDDDAETLEPPSSTLICLILYAASYCLLSDSTSSASIDRFKTKVDSGQPVDNPAKEMSAYMLKRFEIELQRLPIMEKGNTR